VRRLGASHPAVGDLERSIGEALLAQGRADPARPWLERAARLTGAGYGRDDPRSVAARLALALASEDPAPRLEHLALALPNQARLQPLRWRALARASSSRCGTGDAAAARRLDLLARELEQARPEGGSVNR